MKGSNDGDERQGKPGIKNIMNTTSTSTTPLPELTEQQLDNWRKVLFGMIGPVAWILSKEEIETFRGKLQKHCGE